MMVLQACDAFMAAQTQEHLPNTHTGNLEDTWAENAVGLGRARQLAFVDALPPQRNPEEAHLPERGCTGATWAV